MSYYFYPSESATTCPIENIAIIGQINNMKLTEGQYIKVKDAVEVNLQVVKMEKEIITFRYIDFSLIDSEVIAA